MNLSDDERNKLLLEYDVTEEKFDSRGNLIGRKLNITKLADLIYQARNYHFITTLDNQEIYYYNGGYYERHGIPIIKSEVEMFIDELATEHIKKEVIGHIRDKNIQNRNIFQPKIG